MMIKTQSNLDYSMKYESNTLINKKDAVTIIRMNDKKTTRYIPSSIKKTAVKIE